MMLHKHFFTPILFMLLLLCLWQGLMVPALAEETEALPSFAQMQREMYEELQQLEAERGPMHIWTVEQKYDFQEKYRAFSEREPSFANFQLGLPAPDELTQAQAREIAADALTEKYGEDAFSRGYGGSTDWVDSVSFCVLKSGLRYWGFLFMVRSASDPESTTVLYEAHVDAKTGDVLRLHAGEHGWG